MGEPNYNTGRNFNIATPAKASLGSLAADGGVGSQTELLWAVSNLMFDTPYDT